MSKGTHWPSYAQVAHARHAARYQVHARQHTHDYPALEEEVANLMAAAEWFSGNQRNREVIDMAQWLYTGGGEFLYLWSHTRRAIQLLLWAVDAARAVEDRWQEGRLLGHLGRAFAEIEDIQAATDCHERALSISQEIGDREGEANHLGCLGLVLMKQEKTEQAIECYEQALTIAREIGDNKGVGRLLGSLAGSYRLIGNLEKARQLWQQALTIARETGDRQGEVSHLGCLGSACEQVGFAERNQFSDDQRYSAGLQSMNFRNPLAVKKANEILYAGQASFQKANGYYEQALAIAQEIGNRQAEARCLANLARTCEMLNRMAEARTYQEQARSLQQELQERQ